MYNINNNNSMYKKTQLLTYTIVSTDRKVLIRTKFVTGSSRRNPIYWELQFAAECRQLWSEIRKRTSR